MSARSKARKRALDVLYAADARGASTRWSYCRVRAAERESHRPDEDIRRRHAGNTRETLVRGWSPPQHAGPDRHDLLND